MVKKFIQFVPNTYLCTSIKQVWLKWKKKVHTLTCPQADSVSISDDRQMPLIFHEQKRSFFQIDFFPIDFNSHFLHQRYFETFWVFGTFVFIKSNSNCSGPTKCQRVSSIIGDSHWESWIATPIGATPICKGQLISECLFDFYKLTNFCPRI